MRYLSLLLLLAISLSACNLQSPNKSEIDKQGLLGKAIQERDRDLANGLIEKGGSVNLADSLGITPLHWAARRAMKQVAYTLIQNGAEVNTVDSFGFTAFDYARKTNSKELVRILLENGASAFCNEENDIFDGPFVDLRPEGRYAYYLKNNPTKKSVFLEGKYLADTCSTFTSWLGKQEVYPLIKPEIPAWKTNTKEPIVVLGDVHGEFDRLINTLREQNVIDTENKWSFGKGHLVFVGDIFDRGAKVTEILWFIYRLEHEAKKAGGNLHFVFGNHELMILNNDNRYINDRYKSLCKPLGLEYASLFHSNSVLGEWLRTRNSIVQINDYLFVHGGISEDLLDNDHTADKVNHTTRQYLTGGINADNMEDCKEIFSSTGPFWYRGYFMERSKYDKISKEGVDRILEKLNVKTIVVGHTEVDQISEFFSGKIIDVNIPMRDGDLPLQALLIQDGEIVITGN
ncbi:hypothetical protein GCQ56_02610 [Marinifilum sp. N1E240]|uniref:metallophosphoesterase n=1 Tax=Marinifilum sp. N1E240 TaxID=2608082 RepID=UPI00128DCD37|nr:metallophosphoesterase [Marinifilum sp. N1E240]MPQ45890.1 hypothetical protein [Marinifilum sp. N1E240]